MRGSRLLLVVLAVAALIVTGVAPAAAQDDRHKPRAGIGSIDDRVQATDHSNKVIAKFGYSCKGMGIRAAVDLYQGKTVHYDGDAGLRCDGGKYSVDVPLDRQSQSMVRNGAAYVEVQIRQDNRRVLAHEVAGVRVKGAGFPK